MSCKKKEENILFQRDTERKNNVIHREMKRLQKDDDNFMITSSFIEGSSGNLQIKLKIYKKKWCDDAAESYENACKRECKKMKFFWIKIIKFLLAFSLMDVLAEQ